MFTQTADGELPNFNADKASFVRRALSILNTDQKKPQEVQRKFSAKKRVVLSNYLNSELERQEDLFAVKEEETPKTVDFTVTSPRTFVQDHSAAAIIPAKEDSVNETKLTGPTIEEWINSVLKAVVEKMSMPARF